jgi:putative redox protein
MREIKVVRGSGKLAHRVEIGPHHLVTDEPPDNEGEDLGPSPFEYLATALGACTALTAKLYSQRKGWPLDDIDVRVNIERQEDMTSFDRKVRFIGNLDQAQRQRILEIVNHCPVHKALMGRIEIKTSMVE